MAKQADRRASTRKAVLDAAQELFSKRGYDGTTVDEIAAAARVAKGTFYQHFEAKIDVLVALVRRQLEDLLREIEAALEAGHPPLEIGLLLVRGIAQWCEEQGSAAGELVLRSLQKQDSERAASTHAMLTRIFGAAQRAGQIRGDTPPILLALIVVGAMIPPMVHWSRNPEPGQLGPWLGQVWNLVLEGALPRPPKA
jgi:AcrR family transcriptional regulator